MGVCGRANFVGISADEISWTGGRSETGGSECKWKWSSKERDTTATRGTETVGGNDTIRMRTSNFGHILSGHQMIQLKQSRKYLEQFKNTFKERTSILHILRPIFSYPDPFTGPSAMIHLQ